MYLVTEYWSVKTSLIRKCTYAYICAYIHSYVNVHVFAYKANKCKSSKGKSQLYNMFHVTDKSGLK
jgi:hypothetical protein